MIVLYHVKLKARNLKAGLRFEGTDGRVFRTSYRRYQGEEVEVESVQCRAAKESQLDEPAGE